MARYDIFEFNGGYVVDLQADIIAIPGSRVVAPVAREADVPPMTKSLHPRVSIKGEPYIIVSHLLAAAPEYLLKSPVGTVAEQGDEISRALDILFQGY